MIGPMKAGAIDAYTGYSSNYVLQIETAYSLLSVDGICHVKERNNVRRCSCFTKKIRRNLSSTVFLYPICEDWK